MPFGDVDAEFPASCAQIGLEREGWRDHDGGQARLPQAGGQHPYERLARAGGRVKGEVNLTIGGELNGHGLLGGGEGDVFFVRKKLGEAEAKGRVDELGSLDDGPAVLFLDLHPRVGGWGRGERQRRLAHLAGQDVLDARLQQPGYGGGDGVEVERRDGYVRGRQDGRRPGSGDGTVRVEA